MLYLVAPASLCLRVLRPTELLDLSIVLLDLERHLRDLLEHRTERLRESVTTCVKLPPYAKRSEIDDVVKFPAAVGVPVSATFNPVALKATSAYTGLYFTHSFRRRTQRAAVQPAFLVGSPLTNLATCVVLAKTTSPALDRSALTVFVKTIGSVAGVEARALMQPLLSAAQQRKRIEEQ